MKTELDEQKKIYPVGCMKHFIKINGNIVDALDEKWEVLEEKIKVQNQSKSWGKEI